MNELLAIIEVDKNNKVLCGAPECKRSIFKRIHVIRENGKINILGEKCFIGIHGKTLGKEKPKLTGNTYRKLTEEERELLLLNTEKLIEKLEHEYQNSEAISDPYTERQFFHEVPDQDNGDKKETSLESKPSHDVGREVQCLYCGYPFLTSLRHMPAKGYKCGKCKSLNIQMSLEKIASKQKT
ncbi:hypothetical protein [Parendozoicomonas haliclonae]|uniref:Uncharacterized protein n=1 Tax=Parendozoicomonas haliclonae TaxID=1960125 RepID=A0A1X7AR64_9GAMM|nr:hypothetical protein [Parendozoicomonas haliclonae]SMA50811.1 hypothetical protein EHSB41UT_04628 [Parendozoicomonas haliclonae]